jgi:drug/metabolite transporter (DMT)-like permease
MIIWGISWPSNKILTQYGSAINLGIFRYVSVILSLLIAFPLMGINLKIKREGWIYVFISGCLMALYNYAFLEGLHHGSSGAGGILVTTLNPIFAYNIGMLVDWKSPRKNELLGLLIGLVAGLILLRIWGNTSVFSTAGNTLFLVCAFVWASISKFTSKAQKYGSPIAYSWWMYVFTLIALIPFCEPSKLVAMAQIPDPKFWGNVLFSGVITTTIATTIFFYSTSKIGAEKASSFIFIVPLSAALFSYILLGEHLQIHSLVGGFLGIVAVYFINKKN